MMSTLVKMHPIWQSGAIVLGLTIMAALTMQLVVQRFLPQRLRREHTELGSVIFSVIGVTYAVLLTFVATTAWEQHTAAETLARREANLVDALYTSSQGAPAETATAIRTALTSYLEHVIEVEWPAQIAGHPISSSSPLLTALERGIIASPNGTTWDAPVRGFMIATFADLVSVRRDRLLATHGTIPDIVWIVLLSGGALMVSFSFILEAPNAVLHLMMTAALVTSGVLVLLLVAGLSSPFQGEVTIPPDAYRDALASMRDAP